METAGIGNEVKARTTGAAVIALTASEATIYGRYGFAPATWEFTHEVDPKRVAWRGAPPAGRVHTLDPRSLATVAPGLFERSRSTGDIDQRARPTNVSELRPRKSSA